MKLSKWLDAKKGRTTALAAHFDVTLSAVMQWCTNGVPASRMLAVRDFTKGHVKLADMFAEKVAEKAV